MSLEIIGELGQAGLKIGESDTSNISTNTLDSQSESYSGDEKKKTRMVSGHRPKKFRQAWMMYDIFKDWLRPHSSPEFAMCVVCNRVIKAGKSELEKHAAGKRHQMLRSSNATNQTSNIIINDQLIATSEIPVTITIDAEGETETTDAVNDTASEDYGNVTCIKTASFTSFAEEAHTQDNQESKPDQDPLYQTPHQPSAGLQSSSVSLRSPTPSQTQYIQITPRNNPVQFSVNHLQSSTSPQTIPEITTKAVVGHPAPHWKTTAIVNGHVTRLDLNEFKGRFVVLFFYPHDFSRICAVEIQSLSDRIGEFRRVKAEVLACSVDSHLCHLTWSKQPRAEGGIGNPKIALLSDPTHSIAKDYGVLVPDKGHTLRGTFIIDKKGILRIMNIYDKPIGRGIDEILRSVQALHCYEDTGEGVLPDWTA